MMKRLVLAAGMFALMGVASEGEEFAINGPNGSVYELHRMHGSAGQPVASLLITRSDDSATLMDVMIDCAASQYLYLAMDHEPVRPVTDSALDVLMEQSQDILSSNLRTPVMSPITDDPYDAPLLALRDALCEG